MSDKWEKIDNFTFRLLVPGGYIYRLYDAENGIAAVFVPVSPIELMREKRRSEMENAG